MGFHEGPVKEVARSFYEAISQGQLDRLDELVAPDFQDHTPGQPPGRDGLRESLEATRLGFPDLTVSIEDMFVASSESKVAIVSFIHGTHEGEWVGIPPTGKRISIMALDILRISEGRVAERWGLVDSPGLFQQLGVFPGT